MTRDEIKILGPLLRKVRRRNPYVWNDLKYQTQFGPEFGEFPYFPCALDLELSARSAIRRLEQAQKQILVAQWRSKPRMIHLSTDEEILEQYGTMLLDYIVETAKMAGARSNFDE